MSKMPKIPKMLNSEGVEKRRRTSEQVAAQLPIDHALAMVMVNKMEKAEYKILRKSVKSIGCNIYPAYHVIRKRKQLYLPTGIHVAGNLSEVPLNNLLQKTSESILKCTGLMPGTSTSLQLNVTWGMDDGTDQICDTQDAPLVVSLLPLNLIDINSGNMLWKNPLCSSVKYCRPLQIIWKNVTSDVIKAVEVNINREIRNLQPFSSAFGPILFNLTETVVDGQAHSSLASTSLQKCYICGATSEEMSNFKRSQQKITDSNMNRFGLSPLRVKIQFFECLLQISYHLGTKQLATTSNESNTVRIRKKHIRAQLKKKTRYDCLY